MLWKASSALDELTSREIYESFIPHEGRHNNNNNKKDNATIYKVHRNQYEKSETQIIYYIIRMCIQTKMKYQAIYLFIIF